MQERKGTGIPLKMVQFEINRRGKWLYTFYCYTPAAVEFMGTMKSAVMLFKGDNWEIIRGFRSKAEIDLETERLPEDE